MIWIIVLITRVFKQRTPIIVSAGANEDVPLLAYPLLACLLSLIGLSSRRLSYCSLSLTAAYLTAA
jgi:hypothetical protein